MRENFLAALCASVLSASAAQALTMDFSDPGFGNTFGPSPVQPYIDGQTIAGVDFTFAVVATGSNGYRQASEIKVVNGALVTEAIGLQFGVSGNGMISLQIKANMDLIFKDLSGIDVSIDDGDTSPLNFMIRKNYQDTHGARFFSKTGDTWDFADVFVRAGHVFEIIEVGPRNHNMTGARDPDANAILTSLTFDVAPMAPVPLPGSPPLLLAGLRGIVLIRRKHAS